MIGIGRKLTAYSPKMTKTGKTFFSVMDYDKNNPTAKRYATVFCTQEVEGIYDRAKITIVSISGIGIGEYQGRQQVSIFAEVVLNAEEAQEFNTGIPVDISSDDLPF